MAISSILGARLAVRVGTKLVVASGLFLMAAFYVWVTTTSASTSYVTIAAQMVVLGTGMGLTSAPATEAIMGVVPKAKAGVGSAVNDATRLLGGTLGRRGDRQRLRLAVRRPAHRRRSRRAAGRPSHGPRTHRSAPRSPRGQLGHAGHPALAAAIHNAASSAFFDGFHAANYVAAGSPPRAR